MPFRDKCLRNMRISSLLLKKAALAGLTLHQIGSMLYREGYEQSSSMIEEVVSKSLSLYKTINKSLTTRLKLELCLNKKFKSRSRAYSTNEVDSLHFGDHSVKTQTSTPDEPETSYGMVMTIPEEKDEEDEDFPVIEYAGRSLSLPCFEMITSKSFREKEEKKQAFDRKLFYYVEAFIELAIQKKIRDLISIFYLEYTNPNGRVRSVSEVREDQVLDLYFECKN